MERWRASTIAIKTIARNPTLKPATALKTTHRPGNQRTGSPRNRYPPQTTHRKPPTANHPPQITTANHYRKSLPQTLIENH